MGGYKGKGKKQKKEKRNENHIKKGPSNVDVWSHLRNMKVLDDSRPRKLVVFWFFKCLRWVKLCSRDGTAHRNNPQTQI